MVRGATTDDFSLNLLHLWGRAVLLPECLFCFECAEGVEKIPTWGKKRLNRILGAPLRQNEKNEDLISSLKKYLKIFSIKKDNYGEKNTAVWSIKRADLNQEDKNIYSLRY